MVSKIELIEFLKIYKKSKAKDYHLKRIGLFGSFAKDSYTENSDIDIVVEFSKPNLFNQAAIMEDLKEKFNVNVDVVSLSKWTNPKLANRIKKEAIYV